MADAPVRDTLTPANPLRPFEPQPIAKPKLLLGEGQDEVFFFSAMLEHLNVTDVQVEQYAGKNKLKDFLEALIRRSGFAQLTCLAVTRDADTSAKGAFESIRGALHANNLPIPRAVNKPVTGPPKVVAFILPGRSRPGMLEDLCLASAADDKGMPCVKEFFKCVRRQARRKPKILSKARVQAWLASQVQPDLRLGQAAKKGYWPWDHAAFKPLIRFLTAL